jgi:hypothetical protein
MLAAFRQLLDAQKVSAVIARRGRYVSTYDAAIKGIGTSAGDAVFLGGRIRREYADHEDCKTKADRSWHPAAPHFAQAVGLV